MAALAKDFREHGLYTFFRWQTFFTNPPLCMTEGEPARRLRSSIAGWRSPTRR
jgi:hypothetical protein